MKKFLIIWITSISFFLIGISNVSADSITITPSITYRYPTSGNSVFSNTVISDARYWGVNINNNATVSSLVFKYSYNPPVNDSNTYYNYTFKIYSSYETPSFMLNGFSCDTINNVIAINEDTNSYTYNNVYMVSCKNIPYRSSQELALVGQLFNFHNGNWIFGVANTLGVVRVTNSNYDYNSKLDTIISNGSSTNSKLDSTNSKLDSINSKLNKQQQDNDEWKNTDLSSSDKESPDTTEFSNYQSAENNLFDKMDNADLSNLSISVDGDSNLWIWDVITRIYNSNPLIFNFMISILSIGIIKMALGR